MAKSKKGNATIGKRKGRATKRQVTRKPDDIGSWLPAPGELVRRFRDEMDHLLEESGFDNLARSLTSGEALNIGRWAPQVEVLERDGQIVVRADLPGLTKDDISVDLSDSAITIDGQRKQEHEEHKDGYYRSERSYGHFSRRIPLPAGVNVDTAQAQFRNGVLEITMAAPEAREHQTRKLEIEDGSAPKTRAATAR